MANNEKHDGTRVRHVFVSGPRYIYLDDRMQNLSTGILTEIKSQGYRVTAFETSEGGQGHAARIRWSPESAIEAMRSCVGVVLLGFPVAWDERDGKREGLASEYCHYEGALAALLRLPVLALIEEGTAERGAFGDKAGLQKLTIPSDATEEWAKDDDFQTFLTGWIENDLKRRSDFFLGYSSAAKKLAQALRSHLESRDVKTLDWDRDFVRGSHLFGEIERAAKNCSAAILLFTKADVMLAPEEVENAEPVSIPRDNVVFEAGYFAHAKSKPRVLIILEKGVKLPSDLEGDLHLEFDGSQTDSFTADILKEIDVWVDKRIYEVD